MKIMLQILALIALSVDFGLGVYCPDIRNVLFADVKMSSEPPFAAGTVATFDCDKGFKAYGERSVTCNKNGRWSGSIPYCKAFECKRKPDKVEKGRKCQQKCKKDKDCPGSFKKCECDDWCGKSCYNPSAKCPSLKPPENGYVTGRERSYGHSVMYGCDEGFMLIGPSTRRCQSDRKWSGHKPLCVSFSTCGQAGDSTETGYSGKVVEGTDAKEGAWPWQGLLIYNKQYSADQIYNIKAGFGGSSIINDEWILSAAHVFDQFSNTKKSKKWKELFLVILGMTSYPTLRHVVPEHIHVYEPKNVYIHPSYNSENFDYDVALIHIGKRLKMGNENKFVEDGDAPDEKIVFSQFIRPLCMPCMKGNPLDPVDILKNFDREKCDPRGRSSLPSLAAIGSLVTVTGFGKKRNPGQLFEFVPKKLQEGVLKILDDLKCSESIREIQLLVPEARFTNRMFCASSADKEKKVDSCQGDSGGPLAKIMSVRKHFNFWMQIGIVSWGMECGGEHPGFYTSVVSIMSWVWKIVDENRDGLWREWEPWSACSRTCGGGIYKRKRSCKTRNCIGDATEDGACATAVCPPGIWNAWESWSRCSRTCDGGTRNRRRTCSNENCIGKNSETGLCETQGCPPDNWGAWKSWSRCSKTCGGGQRSRTRSCPSNSCIGSVIATDSCATFTCPEEVRCPDVRPPTHGSMTRTPDPSSFKAGTILKFSCDKGKRLVGPSTITCEGNGAWSTNARPTCDDEWGPWGAWGSCTATCDGARLRTRRCLRGNDIVTRNLGCSGVTINYQDCGGECPAESSCGGNGNLCVNGFNVDSNNIVNQASRLLGGLFGRKKR